MARLDRAKLENGTYGHACEITTRFSDIDRIGHVNNVAIADLLQEGRFRFFTDNGMDGTDQCQVVIASSTVEFAGDLMYPDPVLVRTAVLELGRTSVRLCQVAIQNGRVGVYAEAVMVTRGETAPIPIPDAWRTRLEGLKLKGNG